MRDSVVLIGFIYSSVCFVCLSNSLYLGRSVTDAIDPLKPEKVNE